MSDRAPIIETDDGLEIRASLLSQCKRRIAQQAAGEEPPVTEAMMKAAEEGKAAEDSLIELAEEKLGVKLERQEQVRVRLLPPLDYIVLTGHIDGATEKVVVEAKTTTADKEKYIQRWKRQVWVYAQDRDAYLVWMNRRTGETDFISLDLADTYLEVEKIVELILSVRSGEIDWQDIRCECGFCDARRDLEATPVVASIIDEIGTVQEEIKRLQGLKDGLVDTLLMEYDWTGTERLSGATHEAIYVPGGTRQTFDTKAHKTALPECHDLYTKNTEYSESIRVRRKNGS